MATTAYGVNHPLAVKLWARKLFREALKDTYAYKFMGTSDNSLCQVRSELGKDAGDRVTIGLRMQLSGRGIIGDGTLEGNEEALVTYSDNLYIDQLRHAVRSDGQMSEQRVPFNVREEARNGLQDWWSNRIDTWFFNQLTGNTAQSNLEYTGLQATIAPTSTRMVVGGPAGTVHTTEASLSASTTHAMSVRLIDRAVNLAKTASPLIRPIKIQGGSYYVMFIHPNDVYQLRQDAATAGSWADIQKAAIQGGEITKSPYFTGALGMWNGVILHESTRIPNVPNASAPSSDGTAYRRNVFCGAQAAAVAFGKKNGPEQMSWVEELFDYKNQLGVSAGMIGGLKKMVFNSTDFGTITVSTWAPNPNTGT